MNKFNENGLCEACLRDEKHHILGRCPSRPLHINLDAVSLERVLRTGHPRLLGLVVTGQPRTALQDVEITNLNLVDR